MIGGYLFSLSNHFRLCYCVENGKDDFCAFVLTMIESEKYDKLIESTWTSQLHQKYPTIDQVKSLFFVDVNRKFVVFYFVRISLNRLNILNGFTINIPFEYNSLLISQFSVIRRILLEIN